MLVDQFPRRPLRGTCRVQVPPSPTGPASFRQHRSAGGRQGSVRRKAMTGRTQPLTTPIHVPETAPASDTALTGTAPDTIPTGTTAGFTAAAWQRTAGIRSAIDALPWLQELAGGTLRPEIFRHYLTQDALYLADYGRALAAAAAQAREPEDIVFWAESARGAVETERALHGMHVTDLTAAEPAPTTAAYTSYLLSLAASGSYPVLAAGLLPCFWIYDDVGSRLKAAVGNLAGHPYGDWIGTYGDPDFAAATGKARSLVDRLAEQADAGTVARMHQAFHRATRYEWMFWDAAYRQEKWPV